MIVSDDTGGPPPHDTPPVSTQQFHKDYWGGVPDASSCKYSCPNEAPGRGEHDTVRGEIITISACRGLPPTHGDGSGEGSISVLSYAGGAPW